MVRNKLLVVDDEASLVELCQIILEDAGYVVRGAFNGEQALKMVAEEMPDLVLLDVMMPGISGIEVCRELRARHNGDLRIVMYTADEREATHIKSLEAGADGILTKGVPIYEIPSHLVRYLVPSESMH
jgi:two-component system response regulator VicR